MIGDGSGVKRRLILHAGTSKTGSTSLQTYLDHHRAALQSKGFLYPSVGVRDGWMPKHQWLVNAIIDVDQGEFERRLQAVLDECDDSTHTILLSTEGIANHWWDFSSAGLDMLASLTQIFDVSCWIWFREPADFFKSYYLQILKNGRHPRFEAYGQDRSPLEMLSMPWVAKRLDYQGLIEGLEHVFGADSIYSFAYTDDIVSDFLTLLPISLPHGPTLKVNATAITARGVDQMRIANRPTTSDAEKRVALDLAAKLNSTSNEKIDKFELTVEDKAMISKINAGTAATLEIMSENSVIRWRQTIGVVAPDQKTK